MCYVGKWEMRKEFLSEKQEKKSLLKPGDT
jgi:hypothetical protein